MYGHADTAQSLADIAGLPGPKSLFFGGIGNNTSVSPRLLYRTRGLGSVSSIGQTTSYYPDEHAPDSYVLSFRHLFTSYRKAYLSWTILSLSLFSLMIVIGAPLCFICLRGEQRLKTWWLLPAATVGFGLVIWFGGLAVLPRKPLLRIGEFRLGYGSWPEVLVIDALESLTFERETLNVASTSKDSVLTEEFTVSAASREIRKLSGVTPEYQLHWSTRERGSTESKQLIHFVNTPKPLSLVNEGNGKIKVRAMQDLKQLFILYKHEWHVFGSTKAGTSIDPRAGNTFGSIDGLPAQLQALLNLSSGDQFNDPYYRSVPENGDPALIQQSIDLQKSLKEKGLYPDDVIAVTVTTEAPVVRQVEEKADVIFEVVWVLQLPRAEAESTSSSTVSETANSASLNGTAIHSITPNNTIFSSALSSSALSSSAGAGS